MLPHDCLKIANSERARFRVLYVGGDIGFLRALRKVLKEPDYHIVSCSHVGSAIDFLKGNPRYDLLMFEIDLRGLELTKLARSLSHREHLPIVMVTETEIAGNCRKPSRKVRVDEWISKRDSEAAPTLISLLEEAEKESANRF